MNEKKLGLILAGMLIVVLAPLTTLIVVGYNQQMQKIEQCESTGGVYIDYRCVEPHRR